MIAAFGQELVKSGEFTPEDQRLLQAAFQDRNEGDYAGVFPSRDKVERRLNEAEGFMRKVADFLRKINPPLGR